MTNKIDDLLQTPYWIIDILPKQVQPNSLGQYFKVENYFLNNEHLQDIKQKHSNLILKINCYRDITIDETKNPFPETISEEMKKRILYIFIDEAMVLSEPDDTHLTLFNPSEELLELVKEIALSEGLYVWRPTF